MTYPEVLTSARAAMDGKCKACPVCNGKDHECEVVDIIIDPGNADVVAR